MTAFMGIQHVRHPRESGGPCVVKGMDSLFRGNDRGVCGRRSEGMTEEGNDGRFGRLALLLKVSIVVVYGRRNGGVSY
jgi:hypothetical protein